MIRTITYQGFAWIDLMNAHKQDIGVLKDKLHLDPLTLKVLSVPQYHPDFESLDGQINIVFLHPNFKNNAEIEFQEIDIVAQNNYLVTSHYQSIPIIDRLFEECEKTESNKEKYLSRKSGFLLFALLEKFLNQKVEKINDIESRINLLEKEIFSAEEKKTIKEISRLKREIINLWRSTEPQRIIFESLKNSGPKLLGKEFSHNYSTLFQMHRKAEVALKISKETIESLEETHNILVSLKTNEIIGILTVFSVILLPLNLFVGLWGMNTNYLPFKNFSFDFWIIAILMLAIAAGMIFYFKHKKWL